MPKEDEFNLMKWSSEIPLCDDLWLGMQVRNVALVDFSFLRPIEADAASAYMERERTPTEILLPLSALSQMWIFSLYEFLRTWRQRAREILETNEKLKAIPHEGRENFTEEVLKKAKERERMIRVAPTWHARHIAQAADDEFVEAIRNYWEFSELIFRETEALRVTLAKHEIPKGRGLLAEAPGYGRMNHFTGSMYWFVTLKDESQVQIDRRTLADDFYGLNDDNEGIEELEAEDFQLPDGD